MPNKQTETDFIIGRHPVVAALRNRDQEINKVFLQTGISKEDRTIQAILQLAKGRHLVIANVPKAKLDLMSDRQNHQGVILAVAPFKYATIDDLFAHAQERGEAPFFVMLDNVADPHNLGSILRTADAAGVHGVIIPKHRSVGLTATVAKTAAGAMERVPVARVTNLVNTIRELKERDVWIFGTDMQGTDYRRWNAQGAVTLVIGSEGKGISPLVKQKMDELLTIPMIGDIQSLNAAVAAGLLMYQGFNSRHPL
ncbi:23S rRNA (guanosine(2251)-2'-O)-methyltransferase RlmB [Fructilactobacillus cliffordii]|uniref:23S rRNA (guanosine(2251)-2'-O)-methyltransferase RlmB n=1 Tax=Fructilactobacillus cliffordii TaxID=2940299 RepID=UPI0020927933|nr:23S rRNA (guanosine(2251)-2'-O)-methyltransferase RlmB [Fructilactobacillus cliffordii]USS87010.1 23S rRNA (guanosine(2251)-2'-O)-methyltransferase RlmB [Fructilactobacillus cliffordii]